MLIKARHHKFFYPLFRYYAVWAIHRHFGRIEISGEFKDRNLPVLLIANHFSWWDGILAMYLNVNVIKRKFHFMMLEQQIRKFSYPNRVGGYSVQKGSRSILESLKYTSELLKNHKNMVLLFPQGKIESVYTTSFRFESGVGRIIANKGGQVQILFAANLINYFSDRRPGLYFYFAEYTGDKFDSSSLQEAYNLFFKDSINENALKSNN